MFMFMNKETKIVNNPRIFEPIFRSRLSDLREILFSNNVYPFLLMTECERVTYIPIAFKDWINHKTSDFFEVDLNRWNKYSPIY
jgi:hypothetical protein